MPEGEDGGFLNTLFRENLTVGVLQPRHGQDRERWVQDDMAEPHGNRELTESRQSWVAVLEQEAYRTAEQKRIWRMNV